MSGVRRVTGGHGIVAPLKRKRPDAGSLKPTLGARLFSLLVVFLLVVFDSEQVSELVIHRFQLVLELLHALLKLALRRRHSESPPSSVTWSAACNRGFPPLESRVADPSSDLLAVSSRHD